MKLFKKKKDKLYKDRPVRDEIARSSRKLSSFVEYITITKFLATAVIIYYIFSDLAAVYELLVDRSFDMNGALAFALAITTATLLEGFPIILSFGLSELFERKKVSETVNKRILALLLSVIGLAVTFAVIIGFRVLIIFITLKDADKVAVNEILMQGSPLQLRLADILQYLVFESSDPEGFAKNVYMAILPLLTSLFAMADSFSYLSPNYDQRQQDKLSKLLKKKNDAENIYNDLKSKLKSSKLALWNELNIAKEFPEEGSEDHKTFVNDCVQRSITNTRRSCIHSYETEIEHYNKAVQSVIRTYLIEMSKRSTVPQLISDIDLDEIIAKYDKGRSGAESWSYDKFITHSSDKLKKNLNDEGFSSDEGRGSQDGGKTIVEPQFVKVEKFEEQETKTVFVPDIAGSYIDYAKQLLSEAGLDYDPKFVHHDTAVGTVVDYDPKNEAVKKGSVVRVVVSSGPEKQMPPQEEQVEVHIESEQPQEEQVEVHIEPEQPQEEKVQDHTDLDSLIALSEKIVHSFDGQDADEEKKNTQ